MINILGKPGRLCDRLARRELLSIGGLSLFGLSLSQMLRWQQAQGTPAVTPRSSFGAADAVILVYLQGSPSHIDLWDPKPDAPAEIRGEFQPIATAAPGMLLGEVLPKLAQQAGKFTVARSIGVKPKGLPNHGSAIYMLMTGHDPDNFSRTGLSVPPSRDDLPSVGSVVSHYRPAQLGNMNYVALCSPVKENVIVGVGQGGGLLGAAHDPFTMYNDPTQPLKLETFQLPAGVDAERLKARMELRSIVSAETSLRNTGLDGVIAAADEVSRAGGSALDFDTFYEQAWSLLQSDRAVKAFRLEEESTATRERYGMTKFGQSCLLARRQIEAETRYVQVTWPARADDEPAPGPDGSWDTHRNNFPMLREHRCPVFDHSMSALLEDLAQRGLLEKTLVIAIGEFGRSPKLGSATTNNVGPGGRDHWPDCYSFLIAGGGVRPGNIFGESDRFGAYPKSSPVHPYDLIATVYHALGIDPETIYPDTLNRPRRLTDFGKPILELF
ncbi:MAG: DUF1501 domain-containing protein [Planctomycetaceae bacterium]